MHRSSFHRNRRTVLKIFAAAAVLGASLTAMTSHAAEELTAADKQFLNAAAEAASTGVAASRSARGKAASTRVKSLAAGIETDHLKIGDEVTHLAAAKGAKVSDEPSKEQQAAIAKLNSLEKQEFDREFVREIGIAAHRDAVWLFRKAATGAKDLDVQAFAARTLPVLEHHREMAENLEATLD